MTKKFFKLFIILFAIGVSIFASQSIIQALFLGINTKVQSTFNSTLSYIQTNYNEHFNQQKHIQELKKQLEEYQVNKLTIEHLANDLKSLYQASHSALKSYNNIELVKTLSYANFLDYNKIWLDIPDFNHSKMYGLIYKEHVAGIVINRHNRPLALLASDPKCSIAIFVVGSKENAPGIVHGNGDNELIAEFIPTWITINVGDEVITSGLDNLFFAGLKVGKIKKVSLSQGYQQAIIEPYYKTNNPKYFHVIKEFK